MSLNTIREVTEKTGITINALRYYDRKGLLHPTIRNSEGRKEWLYDDEAVRRTTGDSITHDNFKNYYIIEQSEEPGTTIKYKSEITFKCKKTKVAKEAEEKARIAAAAAAKAEAEEEMVWISESGKCYHSKQSCSNMRDPWQVPLSKAQSMDRKPCSKCY